MRRIRPAALLVVLTACAPVAPVAPVVEPSVPAPAPDRRAEADRLRVAGCFACLQDALALYEIAGPDGTADAFRTAILLEIRRRELGVVSRDYLEAARRLARDLPPTAQVELWVGVAESTPWNPAGVPNRIRDGSADGFRLTAEARERWSAPLRELSREDPLAAYLYVTVNCAPPRGRRDDGEAWRNDLQQVLDEHLLSPLVTFKVGMCTGNNPVILADLIDLEPRFLEAQYFLGQREFLQRGFEAAEQHLLVARDAIARWPAASVLLGDVSVGLEEPESALAYYREALALVPDQREALLGEGRALSYLERHHDAIRPFDRLVALGTWYMGEAHYWRAWNRFRLRELAVAWTDVEAAKQWQVTADVYKLAGLVAFYRRDFETSKANLARAIELNPVECESQFYLGGASAETRFWDDSGPQYGKALACFENARVAAEAQVRELEETDAGDERGRRLVARRRRDLASLRRFEANAAFNAAVSYLNTSDLDEAIALASRARMHGDFQERADRLIGQAERRR